MMTAKVKELGAEGFKVTEKRRDCTYIARGADNRIVFEDGSVKRGQPAFRRSSQ